MALGRKKKAGNEADGSAPNAAAPATGKKRKKSLGPRVKAGGTKKQFAMLIGDEGAILVYMEGSKVVRRLFAPSAQPATTEAMLSLMQQNPTVPISLLIDSIDQQYVRQTFPPVSSLSVKGLVKRRLDRDFQAEDMKGFLPLGRDKTGRKEWNFLLIALAKTPALTEWNRLLGIYLVPVEMINYIAMLDAMLEIEARKQWQLIVTHNKVSGFRQVVVNDGKLVFTRVSQAIDDAVPAVIAGNIEQEIINTIEYLRRLGFTDAAGLDMFVVASTDVTDALDLKRFNLGFSQGLTPLDVSDGLELDQAALSADRFGDVVLAAAFLRAKNRKLRFSTAYVESLSKLYTIRKAIKGVAALTILAMLGLSGQNVMTMLDNQAQSQASESKRGGLKNQLTQLQKDISGLNSDITYKAAVISTYDAYIKDTYLPIDFAQALGDALTAEQRISSFEWADNSTKAPKDANGAAQKGSAPVNVKVALDFKGTYTDLDNLSRAEQAFLDALALKMSDYTITHDPFPWLKGNDKGLEISFDQKQADPIKDGDTQLAINFSGPKDAAAKPTPKNKPKGKGPAGRLPNNAAVRGAATIPAPLPASGAMP